jgi:TRAP-type C4-dicarboxylate transport system substrate-binding protein
MIRSFLLLALLTRVAFADPTLLKFATPAPDGTGWARELRAFASHVEEQTHGAVKIKWYFGSITGDELETLRRVRDGQLDGFGSGGMACEQVMPTVKVTRLLGMFQSRGEAAQVARVLKADFASEAQAVGFHLLTMNGMGPDVIFSRTPVRSMADLRKTPMWRWNLDATGIAMANAMGLRIVPTVLEEASRAYDKGQVDGFIGIPGAALAFQWTTRAKYVTDLRTGYLYGCVVLASRAYDKLPLEVQHVFESEAVKLGIRWDDFGAQQDEMLLGGLLEKQGLKRVVASEGFRADFFRSATEVRERLGEKLVPRPLIERVLAILADYRAERAAR